MNQSSKENMECKKENGETGKETQIGESYETDFAGFVKKELPAKEIEEATRE